MNRIKELNGMMEGKTIFIIGSGTSLKGFNFRRLDKEFTIAINHTIEHYPQAKSLIFSDKIFLSKTSFNIKTYKGLMYVNENCLHSKPLQDMDLEQYPNIYIFKSRRDEPVLDARQGLFHPTSCGIMAVSLSLQMKAKRIYLLGYDYYYQPDGQIHFYKDLPHHLKYPQQRVGMKAKKFNLFEKWKHRIINLNPKSLITTFEKIALEDIIK